MNHLSSYVGTPYVMVTMLYYSMDKSKFLRGMIVWNDHLSIICPSYYLTAVVIGKTISMTTMVRYVILPIKKMVRWAILNLLNWWCWISGGRWVGWDEMLMRNWCLQDGMVMGVRFDRCLSLVVMRESWQRIRAQIGLL